MCHYSHGHAGSRGSNGRPCQSEHQRAAVQSQAICRHPPVTFRAGSAEFIARHEHTRCGAGCQSTTMTAALQPMPTLRPARPSAIYGVASVISATVPSAASSPISAPIAVASCSALPEYSRRVQAGAGANQGLSRVALGFIGLRNAR
jgi:hypothetical protein